MRSPSRPSPHTSSSVEIGADGALKVVDEAEVLLIWGTPVDATVSVFAVTIERGVRDVDELGHGAPPSETLSDDVRTTLS